MVLLIGIFEFITSFCLSNYCSDRNPSNSLFADIISNGKVIRKVDLNKIKAPQLYLLKNNGFKLTVIVEKGKIRILDSECPDKTCVISGWLSIPGESVVCDHSSTIVMIEGKGKKSDLLLAGN